MKAKPFPYPVSNSGNLLAFHIQCHNHKTADKNNDSVMHIDFV